MGECRTMKIDDSSNIGPYSGEYTIMVSSSVGGFKTQLNLIYAYLTQLGLNVVMSCEGTLKVNPKIGSFNSCLNAVENCDMFLGIIRQNCGSGNAGSCSITFEEFKRAKEKGKPCWYIIEEEVKTARMLLMNVLELREHPKTYSKCFNKCVSVFYDRTIRRRKKLPKVMQMFEPDKTHTFNEECFAMEDFVNQKDKKNRIEVSDNWMQYIDCKNWFEIERFLKTNFAEKPFIDSIMK